MDGSGGLFQWLGQRSIILLDLHSWTKYGGECPTEPPAPLSKPPARKEKKEIPSDRYEAPFVSPLLWVIVSNRTSLLICVGLGT